MHLRADPEIINSVEPKLPLKEEPRLLLTMFPEPGVTDSVLQSHLTASPQKQLKPGWASGQLQPTSCGDS